MKNNCFKTPALKTASVEEGVSSLELTCTDQYWKSELQQRISGVDSGAVEILAKQEVFRRARERLL